MSAAASWGQPRRRDRPASATAPGGSDGAPASPQPEDVARLLARRRARQRALDLDNATTSEETPS